MLKSYLIPCYLHPFKTATTILAVAFALLLPVALAAGFFVAQKTGENYIYTYEPIVYLNPDITQDDLAVLEKLIQSVDGVDSVTFRDRQGAYQEFVGELDLAEEKSLGLSLSAFPKSLVVKLKSPYVGYSKTFRMLNELRDHDAVIDVDTPNEESAALLNSFQFILILAIFFGIVAVIVTYGIIHQRLTHYLRNERDEILLLYYFGVSNEALGRATIVRGGFLGVTSGLVVLVLFFVTYTVWIKKAPLFFGPISNISVWSLPIVFFSLGISSFLGLLAGFILSRGVVSTLDTYQIEILKPQRKKLRR